MLIFVFHVKQSQFKALYKACRIVGVYTFSQCKKPFTLKIKSKIPLSWSEIKTRTNTFSKHWYDAANEDSQAKPFLIDFFEIFGINNKHVATFEHAVKKHGGRILDSADNNVKQGYVDLFWPGILLVEMKSKGQNLARAYTQAIDYFSGIQERDLPRYVLVCDFQRFQLHDLAQQTTLEFALKVLYQNVK
jgi:hypothetical protein